MSMMPGSSRDRILELEAEVKQLRAWKEERIRTRPKLSRRDLNTRNKELRRANAVLKGALEAATEQNNRLREERAGWRRVAPNAEAWVKLEAENERLRAAVMEFVTAFEQRFKPTGIEDEFGALRRALGTA